MKAGRVVRIRLSPTDCMSVLDGIQKLGLTMEKISFDNAARIVFSSLLEGARQGGVLQKRSGFEYNELMTRGPSAFRLKLESTLITDSALLDGIRAMVVPEHISREQPPIPQVDPAYLRRKARYEELEFKNKADPVNFTADLTSNPELQREWAELCMEFWEHDS